CLSFHSTTRWTRLLIETLWAPALLCLFPAVLNLASMAEIRTNATCGESGPEMYCKLVEHVPGQQVRNTQCRICNNNSERPFERHPIEYAIDGTNRWWQSPSIKNGMDYHYVTITLDLQQVFQIAYIILKAANSPRPGNWVLERSLDGVTFTPWQYYAITDTECLTRFNILPRTGPPSYTRDDEVICTSFYSKIQPLENGEIHTSLINGRPSADDPSPTLLNFTSARYIRLQFQRIRTLNADLMTLAFNDPRDVDPIVTRRYFYSIKDISVGGMCICYGHAKACPLNIQTKKFSCECEHNTCGESCDHCCPGHNQKPWMAGTFLTRHVCEKCNCHGKSEECYFNQTVADIKQSLNTKGEYLGGGVCVGCVRNTAGVNCQTCTEGYYRPRGVSPTDFDPCRPCFCDKSGSLSPACVPDQSQAEGGSCRCKQGYGGLRCDRCAFGYSGFPDCVRCTCSLDGSQNKDPCQLPCVCKENVEGENCDRCKTGFYHLLGEHLHGCEKCYCSGVASDCSDSHKTSMAGWFLTAEDGEGKVWPDTSRDKDGPWTLSVNNQEARRHLPSVYYWRAPGEYLGNKVSPPPQTLTFHLLQGNGIKMIDSRFGLPVYPFSESTKRIVLYPDHFENQRTGLPVSKRDFMIALTNVSSLLIRASHSNEQVAIYRLHSVSLEVASEVSRGENLASAVEICRCPPGYSGTSCEMCSVGHRRVNGTAFKGVCEPCDCHGHTTRCDDHTGQCMGCAEHTTGFHCHECIPGFYGDATKGTANDCQPCACPLNIPSNNFSPTCHEDLSGELLCDQCPPGYTGPRCDRCTNGYFGQPGIRGGSCQPCRCNANLDLALPQSCDPITGSCLRCKDGYAGSTCDICAEGFFGDAIEAKNCQRECCHQNGSVSEVCHRENGQCQCKLHVVGRQCDECMPQTYGIQSAGGCVPCNCNSFGSKSFDCDASGQCRCQPGVSGPKCDRCAPGHFNFQEGGCTPCQCAHVGDNCDVNTGQCVCPPNTVGERCDKCAPNHWGHDITTGCKACGCNPLGSVTQQCNPNTGCCMCREKFHGEKCSECKLGYRDFPQCISCDCNVAGSDSQTCDAERDVCACADRTGKCSCKENTQGLHCDQCKAGTFGLSTRNPQGCSRCYCFGMSSTCSEAPGLIRMWLSLKPEQTKLPLVDQDNQRETTRGVTFQHPEIVVKAELVNQMLTEPYYWRLPEQFTGSMITAYGGKLKYAIYFEGRDETGSTSYEPQVIIKGGPNRDKVMVRHTQGLQIGQLTRHEIDMTEVRTAPYPADPAPAVLCQSAGLFPVALPELSSDLRNTHHRIVSCVAPFEVSVDVISDPLSLQQNCQHNTEGDRCERCAPGYYGVVRGRPDDCKRCACPLVSPENNFSPSCVTVGFHDYRCTACPDGYEGQHCERCATGYHGDPRAPGGKCEECKCDLYGAWPQPCDPGSGQCRCRPGASGRTCSQCMERHVCGPSGIVSCDDDCSGLLISDMDRLHRIITSVNLTTPLPPPYKVLYLHAAGAKVKDLEDEADRLLEKLKPIKELQDNLKKNISQIKELINQARKQANSIKVSVSSGGDCIRAYRPDIKKGSYNTIVLNVKTTSPDNLLFYLGSAQYIDFLALEMRKGKVSFLWDVGSGVGKVEHADVTMHDGNWHRIEASAGIMPTSKSGTSPAGYTILDVDQNAYLFVGGILGSVKKADAVKTSTFSGCMGEAYLDNKPIGLWNYREREGDCKGCVGTVQFDGEGYAAVSRPTRWNPNVSTIMFKFRSFSTDSLLMYFATKDMDFMSAELSDGRVKVSFDLGSGTGSDISTKRHNDGRWKSFTLTLSFGSASHCPFPLKRGQIFHNERRGKSEWQLRRLSSLHRSEVFKKRYAGCMRDIEVSRTPYNLLSSFDYTGLTKGCSVEVSLSSTGFIGTRLISVNIILNQRFCECVFFRLIMEFELRTTAESGLVFYMARINHADFATVQVKEGMAHLGYDLGHGNTSVSVPRIINDGHWHKVIAYTRRVSSNRSDNETDTSPTEKPRLTFIDGCIRNFKMLGSVLDMDKPTSSHHVGSCFVSTEKGTYFDGTGYIKAVGSYRVGLDVGLELEFRTAQSNGVLLGVSSQVDNKMKGLGIELHNGKLLFHVDNGAGRITAQYEPEAEAGLCDGRWHSVTAHKLRHRLELVVDGRKVEAESPNARFNTVDTSDPIYVGGYPEGLKQFGLITSTSFKGCMRDLKITKAAKVFEVQFNKGLEFKGVQPLTCPATTA
uniref:Basement membrane-specific heparan sulfate proteoglycan core protein n=1 Tax=Esox lucius TaxID=8010 RepID=A0A6Q2ZGJ1_ESOLU